MLVLFVKSNFILCLSVGHRGGRSRRNWIRTRWLCRSYQSSSIRPKGFCSVVVTDTSLYYMLSFWEYLDLRQ